VLCEAFRSRRALLHRGETFMFILAQAEETDLFEYKSDLKKKTHFICCLVFLFRTIYHQSDPFNLI
jgi:hypothetical protein